MGSLMAGWDSHIDAKQGLPTKNASLTKEEINSYWRTKRIIEEEHLLAAFKAAARIQAQRFTAEDYRRFEESLVEEDKPEKLKKLSDDEETRIGIKDWWTRSNHAYLNQPPVKSMAEEKPKNKYVAQFHIANLVKNKHNSEASMTGNTLKVF
eukprot:Gb_16039 [translate_table: standard]